MRNKTVFLLSTLLFFFTSPLLAQAEGTGSMRIFTIPAETKVKIPKLDVNVEINDSSGIFISNIAAGEYKLKFKTKQSVLVARFEVARDDTLNILAHFPQNKVSSATSKEIKEFLRNKELQDIYKNLISWDSVKQFPSYHTDSGYSINSKNGMKIFHVISNMPKFNNGDPNVEFKEYIFTNLKLPRDTADNIIQGVVMVQFIVDEMGMVRNAVIVSGAEPALNREALRVINSSPRWTPGKKKGENVKVVFTFPIYFLDGFEAWSQR